MTNKEIKNKVIKDNIINKVNMTDYMVRKKLRMIQRNGKISMFLDWKN